ncbi:MAG: hypothetical protein BJ554DRAFT_6327 [Olpidium bornovanus]|uniref:Uncharacterized protein n=1 Tax=Olpidium bornovanus TaxID=278681 RepID=A0A8H8A224_9FUNG|nr:MAG: hypothetical protein BJ554DRAFT_6327 [Olpidium bornovanus]
MNSVRRARMGTAAGKKIDALEAKRPRHRGSFAMRCEIFPRLLDTAGGGPSMSALRYASQRDQFTRLPKATSRSCVGWMYREERGPLAGPFTPRIWRRAGRRGVAENPCAAEKGDGRRNTRRQARARPAENPDARVPFAAENMTTASLQLAAEATARTLRDACRSAKQDLLLARPQEAAAACQRALGWASSTPGLRAADAAARHHIAQLWVVYLAALSYTPSFRKTRDMIAASEAAAGEDEEEVGRDDGAAAEGLRRAAAEELADVWTCVVAGYNGVPGEVDEDVVVAGTAEDTAARRDYERLVELYVLHVLPPLGDWSGARQFLAYNDLLPKDRLLQITATGDPEGFGKCLGGEQGKRKIAVDVPEVRKPGVAAQSTEVPGGTREGVSAHVASTALGVFVLGLLLLVLLRKPAGRNVLARIWIKLVETARMGFSGV